MVGGHQKASSFDEIRDWTVKSKAMAELEVLAVARDLKSADCKTV